MDNNQNRQNACSADNRETKVIGNYLVSALDMEDQINSSIYIDYLQRENWPADIKPEALESIKNHLTTLIRDTQKHIKTLSKLQDKIRQ